MLKFFLCLLLFLSPIVVADEVSDRLKFDRVAIEVGKGLLSLLVGGKDPVPAHVKGLRQQIHDERGVVLPGVRFRDNLGLPPKEYTIYIREQEVGRGQLEPDKLLAVAKNSAALANLKGDDGRDPVTGLSGRWVAVSDKSMAENAGCQTYTPTEVLLRHLKTVALRHAPQLWGRQEMLNDLAPLLAGAISSDAQAQDRCFAVCHNLILEAVPLQVSSVAELVLDKSQPRQDVDSLSEQARLAAKAEICKSLTSNKSIPAAVLSQALESRLRRAVSFGPTGLTIADPTALEQALEGPVDQAVKALPGKPILCVADDLRLAVRRLTQRRFPQVTVLGRSEVAPGYSLQKALEI